MDTSFDKARQSNLFRVIYLGLCFMLIFTSYSAAQNLMTQIYIQLGHNTLGQICFFSIFFCSFGSSLVSAHFYKKISVNSALILSAVTIPVFMFGGVLVTFCNKYHHDTGICSLPFIYGYSIAAACIQGIGNSFLWLAQARYVNLCADDKTRGVANGIFFTLLKSSTILSSSISTFVLGSMDQFAFYVIVMMISIVAASMFFFIPAPPSQKGGDGEEVEAQAQEHQPTLAESIGAFKKTLLEPKYRFLFSVVLFAGMSLTLYSTSLGTYVGMTIDSDDDNFINQSTGLVFMVLAVGTIVAGPVVGYLADKFDKISLLGHTLTLIEVGLAVTVLACFMKSYALVLVCGFIWGLGDTSINTMAGVVVGSYFKGDVQVLASCRFFQSLGSLFMTVSGIFWLRKNPYLLIGVITGALLVLRIYFYSVQPKNKKQHGESLLEDERMMMMIEIKRISLH